MHLYVGKLDDSLHTVISHLCLKGSQKEVCKDVQATLR